MALTYKYTNEFRQFDSIEFDLCIFNDERPNKILHRVTKSFDKGTRKADWNAEADRELAMFQAIRQEKRDTFGERTLREKVELQLAELVESIKIIPTSVRGASYKAQVSSLVSALNTKLTTEISKPLDVAPVGEE